MKRRSTSWLGTIGVVGFGVLFVAVNWGEPEQATSLAVLAALLLAVTALNLAPYPAVAKAAIVAGVGASVAAVTAGVVAVLTRAGSAAPTVVLTLYFTGVMWWNILPARRRASGRTP